MPILRSLLIALALVATAALIAVAAEPAVPATAGTRRVRAVSVPDQPSYELTGLNESVYWQGQWYAGLIAQQQARDAAAAKEIADRARESQRVTTTSRVTATTASHNSGYASHDDSQFGDDDFDRVSICETGGVWSHQSNFDGGLGIAHGNWNDLRTGSGYDAPWPALPAYGSQASRELQIQAARKFIRRYGIMGWGCHAFFFG